MAGFVWKPKDIKAYMNADDLYVTNFLLSYETNCRIVWAVIYRKVFHIQAYKYILPETLRKIMNMVSNSNPGSLISSL